MSQNIESLKLLGEKLAKSSISISPLIAFLEYLDAHPGKADEDPLVIDEELIAAIAPMLDYQSISGVFAKIIDGELDPSLVKPLIPYAPWLVTQIESSVVLGALDADVLKLIREPDTAPGPQV